MDVMHMFQRLYILFYSIFTEPSEARHKSSNLT